MPSLDPHIRLADATILSPARSVDGVAHSIALVTRPVGYDRASTVTTAIVEGSASGGTGKRNVWFKRGVQRSVKRVTHGEGNAQDVPIDHAMGGNVCACPEPMNLQFHNNDRAIIGGDHANRARPWDVVELDYGGGRRRFLIESVAAFGKAPDSVNYSPDGAITRTQDFGPVARLSLADHFSVPIANGETLLIDEDELSAGDAALYSGMQVLYYHPPTTSYNASERVQFTAADAPVAAPYSGAAPDYLPDDADLGTSASRYFWERGTNALRFNDATRTLGAVGVTVTGWKTSEENGRAYSYIWPGDESGSTVFDLALKGAGTGLAASGGDHRVARAVEAWAGAAGVFVARVNFRHVVADTGFGKAGLAVSNGIRPGARQIVVDWYGGTPRVYTIGDDGTVSHIATFASSADDEEWDVSIARSDPSSNEWTVVWYSGGSSTTVATLTFDLGTDSPLVGPYAAEGTSLRWFQHSGTLGPARTYTHTRDSLSDDDVSSIGVRVAGLDLEFDFSRRRELLLAGALIDSVVNVSTDEEMTTVFDNQPNSRNEYGVEAGDAPEDPPTLILPLESDGDVFRVIYEAVDPPDAPGEYPPAQGRLNFSTVDGSVSENRANYFDMVTILDPRGDWPSGSAADGSAVSIKRDPVWLTIDSVEYSAYSAGSAPSWSSISAGDRTDFPVSGLVLIKQSWVTANLSAGTRYIFRVTGTEMQRTGGFDANSYNLAVEAFESLDDAWIVAATAGGDAGPGYYLSSFDYQFGETGFTVFGDNAVPTGYGYGTISEVLLNADPIVDDSSLTSCGVPDDSLDARGWSRTLWPTNQFPTGIAGPRWVGASADGIFEGYRTVGTDTGGDPVNVCSQAYLIEGAMVFVGDTAPSVSTPAQFGCSLQASGNFPDQMNAVIYTAGVGIALSEYMRRLPAGSTVVEAKAEVVIPDDWTIGTERIVFYGPGRASGLGLYGWDRYINGGLVSQYRETWNGSSWVVTIPETTDTTPPAPDEFSLGWILMGTRKRTRAVVLPEKASASVDYMDVSGDEYVAIGATLGGTVSADGKSHVVNMTEIIQAILDDRDSENDPDGYFLWPTGGTVPNAETIASESAMFGAIRALIPAHTIEDFTTDGATGQTAAVIDTGTATRVIMPTNMSISRIYARVRTPAGTISTLPVPSMIPPLVAE
jgi:hypothetical protein